jgi:hypothetical protein
VENQDPSATATEIGAELSDIESQLTELTREGSAGARPLAEVISELMSLSQRVRPHYLLLQETLERRDLTYELMARLEEVRRRALWLYRRSRLEQIFYSKLKLERSLRDMLYRQILEGYDEFSELEAMESHLRSLSEELLAAELLQEEA